MKKILLTSIIAALFLGFIGVPSYAMSNIAEDFLLACRTYDLPFPPKDWDRYDLRDAAIEVLDEIESGSFDEWPLVFCLKTLGVTAFEEDLDRIVAYEEQDLSTVLRSLMGFGTPDAIEFLFKYVGHEEATTRELAMKSLAEIDFKKMEKGSLWHSKVLSKLQDARAKEKAEWLRKDLDRVVEKVLKAKPPKDNTSS